MSEWPGVVGRVLIDHDEREARYPQQLVIGLVPGRS
jgi:hypothetical protein